MTDTQQKSPSFEQAMQRLQEIVEEMEQGQLPLENILERYEEGIKLASECEAKLNAAEARIELLTTDRSGNFSSVEVSDASLDNETFIESTPHPKGGRRKSKSPTDEENSLF